MLVFLDILIMGFKQVRVADPTFLGFFIDKGVAAAAKVVRKVTSILYLDFYVTSIISVDHVLKPVSLNN